MRTLTSPIPTAAYFGTSIAPLHNTGNTNMDGMLIGLKAAGLVYVFPLDPEVEVFDDSAGIPNGGGPISLGTAVAGDADLTRTLTIKNSGKGILSLANLTLPSGLTLDEGLTTTLAVDAVETFTVRLATTTPGTFNGTVRFDTNDLSENPFTFTITARVLADGGPEADLRCGETPIANNGGPVDFADGRGRRGAHPDIRVGE